MAELDYDALQRLADAATPGPWIVRNGSPFSVWRQDADTWREKPLARQMERADDAWFIAASRTAVPALLARVRETHKAWEKAWRINESLTKERNAAQSTIAKMEDRLTNPTEKEIEAVGQAIRAELRPERKDSGPLYLDHDVHEYESLARAAISGLGSVPSTGEGNDG